MSYDFANLHIDEDSPEGQVLEAIMKRDQISPEEAIRRALMQSSVAEKNPAQRLIGLFSSEQDATLMDEVIDLTREGRATVTTRISGLDAKNPS